MDGIEQRAREAADWNDPVTYLTLAMYELARGLEGSETPKASAKRAKQILREMEEMLAALRQQAGERSGV